MPCSTICFFPTARRHGILRAPLVGNLLASVSVSLSLLPTSATTYRDDPTGESLRRYLFDLVPRSLLHQKCVSLTLRAYYQLYHGFHEEDGYFSYELNRRDGGRGGNGQSIFWWADDPIAFVIYRWDGSKPDDPKLDIEEL
jgi:hypothetical protein